VSSEAVIFDFDGVVVDTEPLHHRAFVRIFEPLDLPLSWECYTRDYLGFDDRDVIRVRYREAGRTLEAANLNELINRKAVAFIDLVEREGVTPYAGVVALIRALHAAGKPLAIASGALRSDIEPILQQLDLTDCFATLVTADQVEVSKPDPASYRIAFARLASRFPDQVTDPARCTAIEDTPAGIAAARGAGLRVIAVTNTYPSPHLGEADAVVAALNELAPDTL
jgi:beta-phosphoglucomutase